MQFKYIYYVYYIFAIFYCKFSQTGWFLDIYKFSKHQCIFVCASDNDLKFVMPLQLNVNCLKQNYIFGTVLSVNRGKLFYTKTITVKHLFLFSIGDSQFGFAMLASDVL